MSASETVPFHLVVAGRRVPGGATRVGRTWRLNCASYPQVVQTGTSFLAAQGRLARRISTIIARETPK